jgi:hypothetical protein
MPRFHLCAFALAVPFAWHALPPSGWLPHCSTGPHYCSSFLLQRDLPDLQISGIFLLLSVLLLCFLFFFLGGTVDFELLS